MQPLEQVDTGRMARTADEAASGQADRHRRVKSAAAALARHVVAGDVGAVGRFVNEHRHGTGMWADVDPWDLVEHLALAPMRRRATPNPQSPESPMPHG